LTEYVLKRMPPSVLRHLVVYWRIWLLIGLMTVIVNEAIDRNFFDHRDEIDGDFTVTVVALVIAFLVSYLVARRNALRRA
jgi:SNF family Na+-dependent transporter